MTKTKNLRRILADNLKALKSEHKLSQTKVAKLTKGAMDQTTVGRIERADIATTVDMIEALAQAFEIEAWQLLSPNFDPKNPPILRERSKEERELWKKLTESAKQLGFAQ
jgi:transcriptional regulator with XRE-family HTH domain